MVINKCREPILIVEGPGDVAALPILIRKILHNRGIYDVQIAPRPKTNVEVRKFMRPGEIERYMEYCKRDKGDSVLIAVDCDDGDVCDVGIQLNRRIKAVHAVKPTAVVLFKREFESMFLPSIEEIAQSYPEFRWNSIRFAENPEEIRGVKAYISSMMPKDKAYKETRDQPRFSSVMNIDKVRLRSPSFRRLESALLWMVKQRAGSTGVVKD